MKDAEQSPSNAMSRGIGKVNGQRTSERADNFPRNQSNRIAGLQYANVAGIPFAISSLEHAASLILNEAISPDGYRGAIRFANAYCVAVAAKDQAYNSLLTTSGLNFPDGKPVQLYMKRSRMDGAHKSAQVRGPSAFEMTIDLGQEKGLRHFFLGSTPETLSALQQRIEGKYERANVCGVYSPPFGPIDRDFIDECVEQIRARGPHIVWVGLGTPKQDFAAQEIAAKANIMCAAVGAAFDFSAGLKIEAPNWVRSAGLEWFFRLATEPRRLWRRYVFGNTRFIYESEKALLGAGK